MAKKVDKTKENIIGGVLVLALGVLFLINNTLGIDISWGRWWPILLIILGIMMILSKIEK